jgi:hypothetical protein
MAMPTTITVKGKYLKLDGTPESGTVQFFSKVYVLHSEDATAVVPSEVKVYLDETGSFEVDLPASNDPNWTPVGWVYRIILRLSGDYSIFQTVIPHDAPGGEIYMTELLPAQAGNNSLYASYSHTHQGYVQESNVDAIVADAIEDTVGPTIDAKVAEAVAGIGDDFAPINHTHAASAIVSGTIAIARLPVGVSSTQVAAGDHTHNYDSVYAPLAHNHNGTYSLVNHNHDSNYAALVHTHAYADITGTPTLNKAAVGLANVDNTADAAKPVSTAQQTALNLKANLASPTFTGTVSGVTKSMVDLGSVDNTSDLAKPISTATQAALDTKQASGSYATTTDITNLDARLDTVEDMTPIVLTWNGSAYVEAPAARIYIGPSDPGAVSDGSVWIEY